MAAMINVNAEVFQKAAGYIRVNTSLSITTEQKLQLYALYKQATEGKCNIPKPSLFDFTAKAKWEAWNRLKETSKMESMQLYVELVSNIDPRWEDMSTEKQLQQANNRSSGGMGGPVVSTLATNIEMIPENEKNIFDWCREKQLDKLKKCLENGESINQKDDENMSLLHWACDRGNTTVVDFLLRNGADIESRDNDGQTPLHYASFCGHKDVVKLLLSEGADRTVKDCNGETPVDACDKSIASLFQ